ncbi:chemotaxis protein CheB [Nannocystaceae bacterium ST9]
MIRVLIVDDSATCRDLLTEQLERDGDIAVAGEAISGEQALERIAALAPDVVTLDIQMPGMGGLATIEAIVTHHPKPILVVTGLDTRERELAVAATRRGALGLANKAAHDDLVGAAHLRTSVRRLASIQLQVRPLAREPGEWSERPRVAWPTPAPSHALPIIAIGCSAGGPKALAELLEGVPVSVPACLAIANHLPADFVSAFARLLASQHAFEVRIADEAIEPEPGLLVLAPGGCDLVHVEGRLVGRRSRPDELWCPRVDALFESLATAPGAHAGVILSGLGSDGTRGLAAMRAADKLTVVQDRASAAVWGMPRAALGSAVEELPVAAMAELLQRWIASRGPRRSR